MFPPRPRFNLVIVLLFAIFVFPLSVDGDLTDVETTQVGGFFASGTPDNSATFQNYFVGHSTPAGESSPLPERRSFFIFDLPTFDPETLIDASFSIYLPSEFSIPANFKGGIEVFEITSSFYTAEEIVDPTAFGLAPEIMFPTFGTGDFYGDTVFEFDDSPEGPFPLEIVIPLSPFALDDIAAASGGKFVITGRMASYDPDPGDPHEIIFSLSDLVVDGIDTSLPKPFLSLSTTSPVPEPSTFWLVSLILLVFGFRRRRVGSISVG